MPWRSGGVSGRQFPLVSAGGVLLTFGLNTWIRFGSRRVIASGFLAVAAGVAALMMQPPRAVVLMLLLRVGFCSAAVAPTFVFSGVDFPVEALATAVGLTVGLGRLGGILAPIMVPVVDEVALPDVLRSGRITGAGLDVFDAEPLAPDHPYRSAPAW